MKRLGDFRDLPIPLTGGALDGRYHAGQALPTDFRVLLNVDTQDQVGRARLPGFAAWSSGPSSNEDLHDQLLGGQGSVVSGNFTVTDGQREVITLLSEAKSSFGTFYNIAATKSRIYASTGRGRNWRILADGLAGEFESGETPWPNARFRMAQVGDFLLFTNFIDPVLIWPLGGPVISTGPNADHRWAAFEIPDLVGLGLTRAGVVAGWNGFAFIGDVVADGTRCPGRVYWSSANAPLEWAPGGESSAGVVDLGGETVLAIEPIGGQLRCYTDQAIYSVTLVGGDAVFLFNEIYRGDLALAFQNSMVNMGDKHLWMVQDSLVVLGAPDRVPNRFEWMHRSAGLIFRGLDGRALDQCPIEFTGFSPIDKTRCHQIATGYDENIGNVWISWPTTSADQNDFDGVRRVTMVLNPRYQKATLVDNGFSAFAVMRYHTWETVRDFMIQYGVCDSSELLSDTNLIGQKEGFPLNVVEVSAAVPTCIWNDTENPHLPMSASSVAAQVCNRRLALECKQCVSEEKFAMVSVADFCIKEFDISSRLREIYLPQQSTVWIPDSNDPSFPNVVQAEYEEAGYPTLIQGEVFQWGTPSEKIVTRLGVNYDAEEQTIPGRLYAQLGVTNSPHCVNWHDADPVALDCLQTAGNNVRGVRPASFPFYRAGAWVAYRLFVASTDGSTVDYSPKGCGVTFGEAFIHAKPKNETWSNQ